MRKILMLVGVNCMVLPNMCFATDYFKDNSSPEFKRFSISAGWLHVMPQGQGNALNNRTAIAEGTTSNVGRVSVQSVLNAIDTSTATGQSKKDTLNGLVNSPIIGDLITENINGVKYLPASLAGTATINGLSQWQSAGTGLQAQTVDTLGILSNYYLNDRVSLQLVAGIPPKVKIKGQGVVTAPLSGVNNPSGIGAIIPGQLPLRQDLFITDLGAAESVASTRAWTPAILAQYQWGKSGQNKFRPYVGAGIMYAYFDQLKINAQTEADLITAGHMIQNIRDGAAGRALDRLTSTANPKVKLEVENSIAPIVSVGFTYDLNERWYSTASVSYAKLSSQAKINVVDQNNGFQLIQANSKIEIDPLISYVGVGYRF